jgi:hypothetical protein
VSGWVFEQQLVFSGSTVAVPVLTTNVIWAGSQLCTLRPSSRELTKMPVRC